MIVDRNAGLSESFRAGPVGMCPDRLSRISVIIARLSFMTDWP
jgi:hypothetical protein